MDYLWILIVSIVAVGFFVWLVIPQRSNAPMDDRADDELIDPSDTRQLAMLVGMMGGSTADTATMRYALQRFEEIHGRKATTKDVGTVIGLMKS